jgi:hypothetical protein
VVMVHGLFGTRDNWTVSHPRERRACGSGDQALLSAPTPALTLSLKHCAGHQRPAC